MTEFFSEQNDQRDPRPIGRFLLGFEDYEETADPFTYAVAFAHLPGHFERHKHKSVKIEDANEKVIDGRSVQLEFKVDRYSYIWKLTIAAEKRHGEDIGTGYVSHGGEQYELHSSVSKNVGYYREYNSQGGVVRERQFDSAEELTALQSLVEQLLER